MRRSELASLRDASIDGHRTWAMLARYTHPRAEDLAAKLAKKTPRPAGG